MRSFARFCLIIFFIMVLPVTLFLAVPKLNGFTVKKVEANLQQDQVYAQMSQAIQSHLAEAGTDEQTMAPEDQVMALVRTELTPAYLQLKIETLLDQTAAWTVDSGQTPPAISFNDIQQKLVAKNPAIKQQLDEALTQLKEGQQQTGGQLPQVAGDQQSQQALQQILQSANNLDSIANGDWTVSLKEPLAGLPPAYTYYVIGLPIAVVLLVLCLIGLLALGVTWPSRLASVGWALIGAAIWNGLLSVIFWLVVVNEGLLRMLPLSGADGAMAKAVVRSIQTAVFDGYITIEVATTVILLVAGLALVISSRFIRRSKDLAPVAPSPAPQAAKPPAAKEAVDSAPQVQLDSKI
jgi:hypothetical protein